MRLRAVGQRGCAPVFELRLGGGRLIARRNCAGFTVLKNLDKKYQCVMISPRNHYLFTPLLASTTVGTLEFRCVTRGERARRHARANAAAWPNRSARRGTT